MVSFKPLLLYHPGGQKPCTCWVAPEPIWTLWITEKILHLPGIEPLPSSLSIYRLSYPGSSLKQIRILI
jgi:hypothetical protein